MTDSGSAPPVPEAANIENKNDSTYNNAKPSTENVNEVEKKTPFRNRRNYAFSSIRKKYNYIARNRRRQSSLNQSTGSGTFAKQYLPRNGIGRPISFDMTENEKKMLEFYKVKLSILESENKALHNQLAHLAKENVRLLLQV